MRRPSPAPFCVGLLKDQMVAIICPNQNIQRRMRRPSPAPFCVELLKDQMVAIVCPNQNVQRRMPVASSGPASPPAAPAKVFANTLYKHSTDSKRPRKCGELKPSREFDLN